MSNCKDDFARAVEHALTTFHVYDCGVGDAASPEKRCFEVSTHSPEGEEVCVTLGGDTFLKLAHDAKDAWEDFDAELHAAEIFCHKRNGSSEEQRYYAAAPDSLVALLADAKAIKRIYRVIYLSLLAGAKERGERRKGKGRAK